MFDDNKPHISRQEFRDHILGRLVSAGWSQIEREKAKMVLEPLLDDEGSHRGISQSEFDQALMSLDHNSNLSDNRIDQLRRIAYEYLDK